MNITINEQQKTTKQLRLCVLSKLCVMTRSW